MLDNLGKRERREKHKRCLQECARSKNSHFECNQNEFDACNQQKTGRQQVLHILLQIKHQMNSFLTFSISISLFHAVLVDYLGECKDTDKGEIITELIPYIPSLATTKDGVRAALMCFWHSIVKDRRVSEN